jgi:hypothetical protein
VIGCILFAAGVLFLYRQYRSGRRTRRGLVLVLLLLLGGPGVALAPHAADSGLGPFLLAYARQAEPIARWFFVSLSGVLLFWALFEDCPRNRRRCPRCWYNMQQVPGLLCPECGRRAGHESSLFRTRRRWRAAVLAVLLLGLGSLWINAAVVRRGLWMRHLPTEPLVWMLPWAEHLPSAYQRILIERVQEPAGPFIGVVTGAWPEPPPLKPLGQRTRRMIAAAVVQSLDVPKRHPMTELLLHWIGELDVDPVRAERILLAALKSASPQEQRAAWRSINALGLRSEPVLAAALATARTNNTVPFSAYEQETMVEAARALARHGPEQPGVVQALIALLGFPERPGEGVVLPVVYRLLADMGPAASAALPSLQLPPRYQPRFRDDPLRFYASCMVEGVLGGREQVLLWMLSHHEPLFRRFAAEELGTVVPAEGTVSALSHAMDDSSPSVRIASADSLLRLQRRTADAEDLLQRELWSNDYNAFVRAAEVCIQRGVLLDFLEQRLRMLDEPGTPRTWPDRAGLLQRVGAARAQQRR